jgi:NADH:ubiquinone oxidoreductase subunit 6 (subunit J)
MSRLSEFGEKVYKKFLSEETKEKSEQVIVYIAIVSFLLHLGLILLVDFGFVELSNNSKLLTSPISAIYTPFSFILIYEVYLLVYYLPKSITTYVGKQYEIISLIVIRRLFKDLANLELTSDWFQQKEDLQFTYDLVSTLILFFLIFVFYRLTPRRKIKDNMLVNSNSEVKRFVLTKKYIAVVLVPVLLGLAIYSFVDWFFANFITINKVVDSIKNVNDVFFDEFFTILILTDVLLLLFSFLHTDQFHKVIRNSGFILSTILIRFSFGVEGLLNSILLLSAVLFGVIILSVHNQYEKLLVPDGAEEE